MEEDTLTYAEAEAIVLTPATIAFLKEENCFHSLSGADFMKQAERYPLKNYAYALPRSLAIAAAQTEVDRALTAAIDVVKNRRRIAIREYEALTKRQEENSAGKLLVAKHIDVLNLKLDAAYAL